MKDAKKKKYEIKELKKTVEKAKENLKASRDAQAETEKLNFELKKERDGAQNMVDALKVLIPEDDVEVIKPKERVKMDKVSTPLCTACNKNFRSNAELEKHIEDKHTQPECSICQKFFAGRQELNQHMTMHVNTILACSQCPLVVYQDQVQAKNHPHKLHVSTNHSVVLP